jgi:hypothetical protein
MIPTPILGPISPLTHRKFLVPIPVIVMAWISIALLAANQYTPVCSRRDHSGI